MSGSVARAADLYVDRRGGVDGHDGSAPDQAVRSISDALVLADAGDTIHVAEGTYRETVRITLDGLRLVADGEAVLEPERNGVIVEAADVVVDGFVVTGGVDGGIAVDVRAGGGLQLEQVWVEQFDGTGVRVDGAGASLRVEGGGVDRALGAALLVSNGATGRVENAVLRGFRYDSEPAALVQVHGSGSSLALDHSLVSGAPRSCVRGLEAAELSIRHSIVGSCGVENDVTMDVYAVVQASDAHVTVSRSLLSGQASAPHQRVLSGVVSVDDATRLNAQPGFVGLEDARGVLAITVDDSPNLDHAMALSTVLDDVDGHLTFFANFPSNLGYGARGDLLDLVDRGHEVGGHAVTNGRLTQEEPLELRWDGVGGAAVSISDDGTVLEWTGGGHVETLDLTLAEHDTLQEVCAILSTLDDLTCTVRTDDPSALPIYANPTGLASGTVALPVGVDTRLAWDRRLPSEGGRHFRNELELPRQVLSEMLGQPVTSLAYPGQKHDAVVRAAAWDVGFEIGRGAAGYTKADHLYSQPFDWMQSPISLTTAAVKGGTDYDALTLAEQEERVRGFARTWATFSKEAGAMGALTIHAAETLDVHEVEWLVDELSNAGVSLWTMDALRTWLIDEGTALEEGWHQGPTVDFDDYRLAADSDAIDLAEVDSDRATDALGQPIYGLPDAGPHEHQPAARLGADLLPVSAPVDIYGDGRFVPGVGETALLDLMPVEGRPEFLATDRRPVWATVRVDTWTDAGRSWSQAGLPASEAVCASVGALPPGSRWTVSQDGVAVGVLEAGADGAAHVYVAPGVSDVALVPAPGGDSLPSATPCIPVAEDPFPEVAQLAPDGLLAHDRTERRVREPSAGCSHASGPSSWLWWMVPGVLGLVGRRRER